MPHPPPPAATSAGAGDEWRRRALWIVGGERQILFPAHGHRQGRAKASEAAARWASSTSTQPEGENLARCVHISSGGGGGRRQRRRLAHSRHVLRSSRRSFKQSSALLLLLLRGTPRRPRG
ncbi:unnamed protein product [Lampetra planeri]